MEKSGLQDLIKSSPVIVHNDRYAYLRTNIVPAGEHFVITKDADEVTVITPAQQVPAVQHTAIEKWFTLIEVRVTKPFYGPGFLAVITKAIAEKDIDVLIVSTFSKDYVLVRQADSVIAVEVLRKLGFLVEYSTSQK